MEATGVLSESSIYIDDSPLLRVAEMRSKARRLHFEHGIDLIIIDYLQLMQGEGVRGENRVQEISYISRSLKALARELNVPVLAVSQLSRAVEWRASHMPQLSDLRESGSIEQDADVVMLLHCEDYFHRGEPDYQPSNVTELIVAKQHNGPTDVIPLTFIQNCTRFESANQEFYGG